MNNSISKAKSTVLQRKTTLWFEGLLIFGFWTIVALLMVGSRALDEPQEGVRTSLITFYFLRSYLWALLTPFIFWMARKFSFDEVRINHYLLLHLAIAVVFAVVLKYMNNALVYHVINPAWAERITLNPFTLFLELNFLYELTIYLAILAAGFGRDYFLRYQERQQQTRELESQLTQARLDTLRMQINPHFLFNTLHAISSLVERDPKGVRQMVVRLSDLLRYTLDESEEQEVPLNEELDVLDAYLDVQRIRFQGRLEIRKEISADTLNALVPPLILQPLLENAIKHGIGDLKRTGIVKIKSYRKNQCLNLCIADNGPGLPENFARQEKGVGLQNVRERLDGLYGDRASLNLSDSDLGGLKARIALPFHTTPYETDGEIPSPVLSLNQ